MFLWWPGKKLLQLGWEILIHSPDSPDFALWDFHLFWSLQNSLNGKKFQFPGRLQKAPGTTLCSKRQKVLGRWNYDVAWKMTEGSGTK